MDIQCASLWMHSASAVHCRQPNGSMNSNSERLSLAASSFLLRFGLCGSLNQCELRIGLDVIVAVLLAIIILDVVALLQGMIYHAHIAIATPPVEYTLAKHEHFLCAAEHQTSAQVALLLHGALSQVEMTHV